ncbi:hypothetical protein [Nonomuraea sp. B12E4]|uniref:hypothetical protein n=1 Tax=Nonomuraea sp. B12E4 TaxID=3153564 RepID=UPI00325F9AB5
MSGIARLAGAVGIGDPRGSQRYRLTGVAIGGHCDGSVQGASPPGPIWTGRTRTTRSRNLPWTRRART